jgi:hypothetical protein
VKFDLKETPPQTILPLVAVAADQAAANLGTEAVLVNVEAGSLSFVLECAPDATNTDRLREVFIAHLGRRLGEGFDVFADFEDRVTVTLKAIEHEAEDVEAEDVEEGAETPSHDAERAAENAPRRRGRPPGSKNQAGSGAS